MDPSLLKERDAFLKHAAKNVTVSHTSTPERRRDKKKKKAPPSHGACKAPARMVWRPFAPHGHCACAWQCTMCPWIVQGMVS